MEWHSSMCQLRANHWPIFAFTVSLNVVSRTTERVISTLNSLSGCRCIGLRYWDWRSLETQNRVTIVGDSRFRAQVTVDGRLSTSFLKQKLTWLIFCIIHISEFESIWNQRKEAQSVETEKESKRISLVHLLVKRWQASQHCRPFCLQSSIMLKLS